MVRGRLSGRPKVVAPAVIASRRRSNPQPLGFPWDRFVALLLARTASVWVLSKETCISFIFQVTSTPRSIWSASIDSKSA
jgi:hypothetical protein